MPLQPSRVRRSSMLGKLWSRLIWMCDPDRIHRVSGYVFLILALLLLVAVVAGWADTPRWQGWDVH